MAEERWEKQTLKLTEPHGWHAKAGYNVFVADRGAVRFDIPQAWLVKPDSKTIKFHDREPPDDDCTLALTVMRLPPADWSGMPVAGLVASLVEADRRPSVTSSGRGRRLGPVGHRPGLGRGPVQRLDPGGSPGAVEARPGPVGERPAPDHLRLLGG